ncbi:hypothetical protein X747_30655 [Mesorhizobium sp. LNJC384A00]|nr:hypothetical protein X747_30655 [Mesorhizobium sp. LNJC384A00]
MASRYHEVYAGWKRDPEQFWADAAEAIDWYSPWTSVFDAKAGVYGRWFNDATCNTCYNAIDRHVAGGRADQVALIYDSAITGTVKKFTYAELKREVVALTSVLKNRGIVKGDRVIIYMPMVAEAAIAILACARIGAVHSVVFGGFASHELATRIGHDRQTHNRRAYDTDSGPISNTTRFTAGARLRMSSAMMLGSNAHLPRQIRRPARRIETAVSFIDTSRPIRLREGLCRLQPGFTAAHPGCSPNARHIVEFAPPRAGGTWAAIDLLPRAHWPHSDSTHH